MLEKQNITVKLWFLQRASFPPHHASFRRDNYLLPQLLSFSKWQTSLLQPLVWTIAATRSFMHESQQALFASTDCSKIIADWPLFSALSKYQRSPKCSAKKTAKCWEIVLVLYLMFSCLNDAYRDATSQLLVAALEPHVLIVKTSPRVYLETGRARGC